MEIRIIIVINIYHHDHHHQAAHLDRHDGEGDPETADRVGDEDEADHHHERRGHQHRLDGLKWNG